LLRAMSAAISIARRSPRRRWTSSRSRSSPRASRRGRGLARGRAVRTLHPRLAYRTLKREDFDAVIAMHLDGRRGLLHRDGVGSAIMARKRARITAITGGGAIADVADLPGRQDPTARSSARSTKDFAVEANVGDIFQLGNTSWRILKGASAAPFAALPYAQGPAALDPVLARAKAPSPHSGAVAEIASCAK
jgi:hypothetical protein